MLKALIKKQFLELNTFYFQDRKTGNNRSKTKTILMILLFAFVFFSVGVLFYGVSDMLGSVLIPAGLSWFYFALMCMISLALGVFGSVFNTYAGLYHAKDNELLLSMPIQPSKILFVRMIGVYAMGLLYESLVFVPAIIKYFMIASPSVLSVVFSVLLVFILGFIVLALTCFLGWIVALIAGKLKNKSFFTVLFTLIFLAVYYFVYFRMNTFLQNIILNANEISKKIKTSVYPVYKFGLAATGDISSMLIFTLIAAVFFAVTYYLMSVTFSKIVTTNSGVKKTAYVEKKVKLKNERLSLVGKELRHFISSPTYMLNCGLGIIFMIAISVFALIKSKYLSGVISELSAQAPFVKNAFPIIILCVLSALISTIDITAPSVSLEGKNIWILQSFPVKASDVLLAKQAMSICISIVPTVICTLVLLIVFKINVIISLLIFLAVMSLLLFYNTFGLFLNLKKPVLEWTNETVPIKQSMSVVIALFGGIAISAAIGFAYYFLINKINLQLYLGIIILLFAVLTYIINRWIFTKGAKKFESL